MTASLQQQVRDVLEKYDCDQRVFARLVGIADGTLSDILHEKIAMQPKWRKPMTHAVLFLIEMQKGATVPVCFHDFKKIEKYWLDFRKVLDDNANEDAPRPRAVALMQ